MTDAEKREKVIRGLEAHANPKTCETCAGEDCPYYNGGGSYTEVTCSSFLAADALAMLKEQEPRVMTVEEVETSKGFVWMEFHSLNENRLSLEYVNVRATEHFPDSFVLTTDSGINWLRDRGDYNRGIWFGMNSGWRCWTSRPTPEQMRGTKWEGDVDET